MLYSMLQRYTVWLHNFQNIRNLQSSAVCCFRLVNINIIVLLCPENSTVATVHTFITYVILNVEEIHSVIAQFPNRNLHVQKKSIILVTASPIKRYVLSQESKKTWQARNSTIWMNVVTWSTLSPTLSHWDALSSTDSSCIKV